MACSCAAAVPSEAPPNIEHMFVEQGFSSSGGTTPASADSITNSVETMPLPEVEREICELAAHINAATCHWLTLAAEFDRRGGHEEFGFVSCASWLAWRCSITPRAAREQLRVARCLRALPRITAAFRRGSLSYSKVRALTRVAEPAMEMELLELAEEATAAQLERLLRAYRGALEPDAASMAQNRRHLATRWEDDGSISIRASLPPDEAAVFLKGLEIAREELRARSADDQAESGAEASAIAGPDRADALVALAESAIARGAEAASGGDRHQVVVHIDLAALGSRDADAAATLDEGVALPAETARRLGCDASVIALVERDGEPLSVGRKTRSIPPALARALRARDGGCRFPGCGRDRFIDAHHIEHWAHGGETSLDNLVQLCRHHHRLVHEGGWSIARESRGIIFRSPSGRVLDAVPPLPEGSLQGCLKEGGRHVDAETIAPGSRGEPIDYDLAVFVLADLEARRREAGNFVAAAG